ncbi:UrcA family protein [Caulobacter sp. HMWF009]|nr:UrcA family protein [Caulobacter sp. HMWF009]PTS88596.1 UrcA family protein [Caulobacter sp. HMWF009]
MRKFIARLSTVAALALAIVPVAGLATTAHAQSHSQPVAHIRIGDLKLDRPADAAEFHRRTRDAADTVCAARTHAERLGRLSVYACHRDFHADAQAELSRTQLADLRRAGRAAPTQLAAR